MSLEDSGPLAPPPEFGPVPEQPPAAPPYVRKYSVAQRLWLLLVSPRDAMQDIALAPEYGGALLIIVLQMIVAGFGIWLFLQKVTFTGAPAEMSWLWGFLTGVLAFAVFLGVFALVLMWLVKALLVKWLCNSGSDWNFKTAAAVTGYAYIADLVFGVIGILMIWLLVPQVVINVSSPETAAEAFANCNAQFTRLKFLFTLPASLLGLTWKSYLGALGARFGTREKCSLSTGFIVFFVLGLLGILIGLIR